MSLKELQQCIEKAKIPSELKEVLNSYINSAYNIGFSDGVSFMGNHILKT
jgi:hypothetical protein